RLRPRHRDLLESRDQLRRRRSVHRRRLLPRRGVRAPPRHRPRLGHMRLRRAPRARRLPGRIGARGSHTHLGRRPASDRRSRRRLAPRDVLTGVFGYAEFRPGQEKIIGTVLSGRDCIGVMPTGAGKSLTFQIPARILRGTVLVVSPLISLMKDQVDALARNGFRATVINSTLDPETRRDRLRRVRDGDYELVYVAPEGLEGSLRAFLAGGGPARAASSTPSAGGTSSR